MLRKKRARRSNRRPNVGGVKNGDDCSCPFCGGPLMFSRLAGVRGALHEGQDVAGRAGELVYIDLCGMPVAAVVADPDSPIARQGFQVLFLLCSGECATAVCLTAAFDQLLAGREPESIAADAVFGLHLTGRDTTLGARFEEAIGFLLPMLRESAPNTLARLAATLTPDLVQHIRCPLPN
jgi:hypothetical protein